MERPSDPGSARSAPPLTSFHSYGLDLDRNLATFELANGYRAEQPIQQALVPGKASLRRIIYYSSQNELVVTLPAGDDVVLEMPHPAGRTQLATRPVVYLDQLHWVTLAQSRWAPEKVTETERVAANELMTLAQEREITVPLSSGNMTETTQMDGRHRRHLATTMLAVSRGWQMRNPIAVRRDEMRAALIGEDPVAQRVFTLDPGAVFANGLAPLKAPTDFPPEWQRWFQIVTSVNAMADAMIDDERLESPEGKIMAAEWSKSHHELALYMREHRTSREKARLAAFGRLVSDLEHEILAVAAETGGQAQALGTWLEDSFQGDLSRMPYLGRQYEVIYDRLQNADDHWEANDLTDINYLCCAAGYADFVVGEKKICGYLNRLDGRVVDAAVVCRKLGDLIEPLKAARDRRQLEAASLSGGEGPLKFIRNAHPH